LKGEETNERKSSAAAWLPFSEHVYTLSTVPAIVWVLHVTLQTILEGGILKTSPGRVFGTKYELSNYSLTISRISEDISASNRLVSVSPPPSPPEYKFLKGKKLVLLSSICQAPRMEAGTW